MERSAPSYGACFLSILVGLAPIFLVLGVAGFMGANTVTANGQNVYGVTALIVAAILNLLFAAIFAGLQKLGFWLLGLIRRNPKAAEA